MSMASIIQPLLIVSVMLSVLALAMRAHPGDALHLVRHWPLGLRAFVALFVVVPAAAVAIVMIVDPPPAVKIAIIALAFSPTPPVLPKAQLKAGGSADYVTSLLIVAALASLLVAPVGIRLVSQIFGADEQIGFAISIPVMFLTIGLPLLAGFAVRAVFGERSIGPAKLIGSVSSITLAIGIIGLLVLLAPSIWEVIGHYTVLALVSVILAGIVAGFALGGPAAADRDSLAFAAACRHPGVATAIAVAAFPEQKLAVAAIWLSAVLSTLLAAPLIRRLHRSADVLSGENARPS